MLSNLPILSVLLLLSTTGALASTTGDAIISPFPTLHLPTVTVSKCVATVTVTATVTVALSTSSSSLPPSPITSSTSTSIKTSVTTSSSPTTTLILPTGICFADNINNGGRTLNGPTMNSSDMTNELCQQFCTNLNFPYSGTEFADQCFCGLKAPTVSSTACTMHCASPGSTELCGGANALSLSVNAALAIRQSELRADYQSFGCYSDDFPSRVLIGAAVNSSTMTVESCLDFCSSAGFTIAGLEYHNECFCDNHLFTNNVTFGVNAQSECTYSCIGDPEQICGGPDFLSVYANASSVPLLIPSLDPFTTNGFELVGCFSDSPIRTLPTQLPDVESVEACITGCAAKGFSLAGLEFSSQCFCGLEILNNAVEIPSGLCDLSCIGNSTETCGGADALQLYSIIS